jgi:uncharacterized membrane protein
MNNEVKVWWQSKIIWTQIISMLFAVASAFQFDLGERLGLSQEEFLAGLMVVVGILTTVLRWGASATVVGTETAKQVEIQSLHSAAMSAPSRPSRRGSGRLD